MKFTVYFVLNFQSFGHGSDSEFNFDFGMNGDVQRCFVGRFVELQGQTARNENIVA